MEIAIGILPGLKSVLIVAVPSAAIVPLSVGDTSYGTTDECKAVIKRVSDTTVDITLSGFANLSGAGGHMSLVYIPN